MKPAVPFPSQKSAASLTTETSVGGFSFPLTATHSCKAVPVLHVTQEFRDGPNAVLRRSQSGTGPSSSSGSSSSLVDVGPQGLVQSLKGWPVGYVATPTTHHQLEERRRTQWRGVKENLDRENIHQKVKICTTLPSQLRSCGVEDLESDVSHLSALVPEELASVLYDLFVRQQTVGLLLTQGEDLPQGNAKRPHIARCGELTLVDKKKKKWSHLEW